MNDWEPRIVYSIDQLGYLLYLTRMVGNERQILLPNGKIATISGGAAVKERQWLVRFDSPEQLRSLVEQVEKQGVQSPSADIVAGELKATKYHLEDMRTLLLKEQDNGKRD